MVQDYLHQQYFAFRLHHIWVFGPLRHKSGRDYHSCGHSGPRSSANQRAGRDSTDMWGVYGDHGRHHLPLLRHDRV